MESTSGAFSRLLLCFVACIFGVTGSFEPEAVQGAESIPNFETIVFGLEPSFDVPVINVTIQEGDMAVLPCSVDYLGDHKVVWTDKWSTLLTLDDRRIIDDPRISIERPFTRDWNLHIRNVVYSDRGKYTCQINTNPVKTKTVMLIVLVPPKISAELSSKDKVVREGDTVQLICNVTGVPTPEVTWYKLPSGGSLERERLDLEPGSYTSIDRCDYTLKKTEIGNSGEVLIIHNVSRYCDGTYACLAYNNVDPAVTRQIKVFVEFPPEVTVPIRRMGQYIGMETILDCEITAYPHGYMGWMKDGEEINQRENKNKYRLELYSGNEDAKKKTLSLRIIDIAEADFGQYVCFSQNEIGEDRETMYLYDYSIVRPPTPDPTQRPSTQATTIRRLPEMNGDIFNDKDEHLGNRFPISNGITGNQNDPYKPGKEFADSGIDNADIGKRRPAIKCSGNLVPVCEALGDRNSAVTLTCLTVPVFYTLSLIISLILNRIL